jgi:hypothetical protein
MGSSPKQFSRVAGQVLVVAVSGCLLNLSFPTAIIALPINVVCIWWLFRTAVRYSAEDIEGFDATVAAEAIVGFGILSLVLGLASVAYLFSIGKLQVETEPGHYTLMGGMPFIEGLLTAGLAPFFAIMLRLRVAESGESVSAADDMADLSRAAASLTRTLSAARSELEQFQSGATRAATTTQKFASTIETETDRWGVSLEQGSASASGFGTASQAASSGVRELAEETVKLKTTVVDTTKLLDELARLISSVERFVAPAAAPRR